LAKSNETDRESTTWPTADRPFPELASALRSQANQIVEAWTDAVRAAIPPATDLPSHELQEHLPAILGKMADAMDSVTRHDVSEPMQHSPAQERTPFQHRYDVRALITEDRLLRRVIIERVKVALGRQMIQMERVALNTRIDTMLREAVRAQNGWADRSTDSSKPQAVVMPTSTPVAQTRSPSLSPEEPTATKSPMLPASLTKKKAAIPVFVELPAQPQAFPVALAPTVPAQIATSSATELIRALRDSSAERASEAATAPGKVAERAAESPQAAAALNAGAAHVNEVPAPRAATVFPEISVEITQESIAVAAYYIWENNGRQEGRALRDWLQAEAQLTAKREASQLSN